MQCKHTAEKRQDWIRHEQNEKKISCEALIIALNKNLRLFLPYLVNTKLVGKITRLFQEFKTLYEPCNSKSHLLNSKSVVNERVRNSENKWHLFGRPFKIIVTCHYFWGIFLVNRLYGTWSILNFKCAILFLLLVSNKRSWNKSW